MTRATVGMALVASLLGSCGGDDDPGSDVPSAGAGGQSSAGAAGEAGQSGGGGDAGSSGAPGWPDSGLGPPASSVTCPTGPCDGSGGLEPCCAEGGECGARYLGRSGAGCVPLDGDGLIDNDCPDSGDLPGCCRPGGTCGAFYTPMFGCVDPTVFPGAIDPMIPCTRTR